MLGLHGALSLLGAGMRGKPRRGMLRRAVFSDFQRKGLEKVFQKQKYISKPDRKKLAEKLGLKDSQVFKLINTRHFLFITNHMIKVLARRPVSVMSRSPIKSQCQITNLWPNSFKSFCQISSHITKSQIVLVQILNQTSRHNYNKFQIFFKISAY